MSAYKFIPGDVVEHKVGGPLLCVIEADHKRVICGYWDGIIPLSAEFDPCELELATFETEFNCCNGSDE